MILPDANILLYAYNTEANQHTKAREWLETMLSSPTLMCFSWQTISAFIRISTNQRVFTKPYSLAEAFEIVEDWLSLPNVVILQPTRNHLKIFKQAAIDGQAAGALLMDAHLAALAIEHGATLATNDRDFSRFEKVKTVNPLIDV